MAAASNQKIFSGQLAAASIQERPLIKKKSTATQFFNCKQFLLYIITFSSNFSYIHKVFLKKSSKIGHGAASNQKIII